MAHNAALIATAKHTRAHADVSRNGRRYGEESGELEERAGMKNCAADGASKIIRMLYHNQTMTNSHMSASGTTQHAHDGAVAEHLRVAQELCEQLGRRLTPIRRQVLELLLRQNGRSLKAYEFLDGMREVHPGSAPPTVYRALDFLVEAGLIHRLDAVNAWIACHDAGGAPHDLLVVCTHCGAVAEISDPVMSARLAERVALTGFKPTSHETEIRALCATCQKDPAANAHAGHHHGHGHSHG